MTEQDKAFLILAGIYVMLALVAFTFVMLTAKALPKKPEPRELKSLYDNPSINSTNQINEQNTSQ